MARYSGKDALSELKELESKLLARTEELLKSGNYREVARLLLFLDNEIYKTEREARRLRLMGKLDYEVYHTLITGYMELQRKIIEISGKNGFERGVRKLLQFLED